MKKKVSEHAITVNNKKYFYSLKSSSRKGMTFFECKAANIAQNFLNEDIASLLIDLPELILEELEYESRADCVIRFRLSAEDKSKIIKNAYKNGYKTVSSFLRDLAVRHSS